MYFVISLTEMSIFLLLTLIRLELRSASESIQPNLGRPYFELGSASKKFGVWTGLIHSGEYRIWSAWV